MNKRLLLINVSLNKGSTGHIAEQIGLLANKNGYDVFYAHGTRYVGTSAHQSFQIGNKLTEYIHAGIYNMIFGLDGFGSVIATKKLINWIDSIQPDIIHLHNIHGYSVNFRILFEYLNRKKNPAVWTLHDCWSFTGGCTFLNRSKCEQWKKKCIVCPFRSIIDNSCKVFELKKSLFSKCKNLTLVPVSNWLDNLVKESFLSNIPSCVIHNGTDLDVFHPMEINSFIIDKYQLKNKNIILGVASPWSARKGLNDFIQLAKMVSENYRIVLIGLNNRQISKLPSNIIGIEHTESTSELAQWYSLADVFVNPTYSDNFPTTNIEALACGTPIITYRTGGSPEAIDSNTGITVNQGDVKNLHDAISKICSNKHNFSNLCRQRAESFFNKNSRFKEYIVLYNQILQK